MIEGIFVFLFYAGAYYLGYRNGIFDEKMKHRKSEQ